MYKRAIQIKNKKSITNSYPKKSAINNERTKFFSAILEDILARQIAVYS